MEKVDLQILKLVQKHGKITNKDLSERVNLSPAPCLRRVKRLEDEGYILGYHARLDATRVGLKITVLVNIKLNKHSINAFEAFQGAIKDLPQILECHLLSGSDTDYSLKVMTRDMDEYNDFVLTCLSKIDVVESITSSFVMRTLINTAEIPL